MNLEDIPAGSRGRFKRVMELRKCSEIEALNFCISVGWAAAEKIAADKAKKSERLSKPGQV